MRLSRLIALVWIPGLLAPFSACGGKSELSPASSVEGAGAGGATSAQVSDATSAAPSTGGLLATGSGGDLGLGGAAGSVGSGGGPALDDRSVCSQAGWSSPSQVVLSHTKEGVLSFVHADGNVTSVDLTYPDKPNDEVHQSLTVTSNENLIAVASGWSSFSPTLMASVAMFERDSGEQRFHTLLPGYYLSGAFQLSADGSVVVGVHHPVEDSVCLDTPGPCDRVVVVEPNGQATFFEGYAAFGPRIEGHLLVTPSEPEGADPVWLDFESGRQTPLSHWADRIDTLRIGPDALSYLARTGDLVELVTETPTNVDVLPLEGLAEVLDPETVRYQVGDHELVYPESDGSSVWRLDLRDGSLEHVELPLPEGVTPLLCYNQGVFPDDTGALTLPVRDRASAWVVSWEGDAGWQPLGVPLTDIQAIQLTARGGTYFIRSWAPGSLFCDEEVWADPGEALLSGDALELVRPADGILELLESPTVPGFLNANGTCFYRSSGGGFSLRDVFRAEAIELPLDPGGILRWVEPS